MEYKVSWDSIKIIVFILVLIAILLVPAISRAVQIEFTNVINLYDNNILTIENPTENDETDEYNIIGWKITDSNGNLLNEDEYNVEFESSGLILNDEDAEELGVNRDYLEGQLFFRYVVGKSDEFNNGFVSKFEPKQKSSPIDYTSGKLKLRYSPNEYGNEDWYELLAGTYRDTITITVTTKNN